MVWILDFYYVLIFTMFSLYMWYIDIWFDVNMFTMIVALHLSHYMIVNVCNIKIMQLSINVACSYVYVTFFCSFNWIYMLLHLIWCKLMSQYCTKMKGILRFKSEKVKHFSPEMPDHFRPNTFTTWHPLSSCCTMLVAVICVSY